MADNVNLSFCPKPGYCRYATRCKKIRDKLRKSLQKQGYALVTLEYFQEENDVIQEVENELRNLGYVEVDSKTKLWRLELEKRLIYLEAFEANPKCPD